MHYTCGYCTSHVHVPFIADVDVDAVAAHIAGWNG
jgi:hypothetical protein